MLTQDDFVAPNMSGEGHLQRSSWKADAIRRGDLKISGPIPITEDIPLNEEEEREYAEKHREEQSALPQDTPGEQDQHRQVPSRAPPTIPDEPQHIENKDEDPPQVQEEHHDLRHKKSSSELRNTSEMYRRSGTEPISYNTPSPFPSMQDSSAKTTPKKKRKSGLRHVFRKMFGRKSRDGPLEEEEEKTVHRGHSHHASDPGLLRRSSERKTPARGPRISDIPVNEPEPINPLGQHLPFPMNVNAPQEASPPHEYLTFQPSPDLGRRRASLPNVLANAETQSLDGRGRRLEPWEERQDLESIPSPQIGIALSSPPAHQSVHSLQSKRRSRSAGALRDLVKGRPSIDRRRSAEIRYWRNSYTTSLYSTTTPRPRTAQTVESVRTTETKNTTLNPGESVTEIIPLSPPVPQHDQDISEIPLSVEAFNFGNLKSDFSDDEDSEERPEPPPRSESRLSIEDRVKNLEANIRTLETSVNRLSGRSNRQTIILENAPKGRKDRNRSSSGSERQGSHHSSRGSSHTLQFRQHEEDASGRSSPGLAPLSAVNELPSTGHSNRDTVIAISQLTHPSTLESQLSNLHTALTHERQARKTLEATVSILHRELADLRALVNKLIHTTSPSYPTPSPDAIISSGEERMPTPRAVRTQNIMRSVDSEEGSAMSSREDITSPEDWATPKEESGFGSGFFGPGARSREEVI